LRGGCPLEILGKNRALNLAAKHFCWRKNFRNITPGYRAAARFFLENRLPWRQKTPTISVSTNCKFSRKYIGRLRIGEGDFARLKYFRKSVVDVNFRRSVAHGLGCMATGFRYVWRAGVWRPLV